MTMLMNINESSIFIFEQLACRMEMPCVNQELEGKREDFGRYLRCKYPSNR